MCTAVTMLSENFYFGRNLDYEHTFGEAVTITPRNFKLSFRHFDDIDNHYAIIGMAAVSNGYPLYFDATNEKGLSIAGLNFPEFAFYKTFEEGRYNIAPYEFIPWILSQCTNIIEVRELLKNINIEDVNFSEELQVTPMHWIISDKEASITVEPVKEGLMVYDNPVGILTNSPSFDMQMFNLNNYMALSRENPKNTFLKSTDLKAYSRGMGAMGLPGDLSSMSRFVRACFVREKSSFGLTEEEKITQFFHILYSVYQQKGVVDVENGKYEMTNYSSCCNTDKGIYYYTTYGNSAISAVDMHKENLDGDELKLFPLETKQKIFMQN